MIESIARRISIKISESAQNDVSINVMSYALGVYINFFSVIVLSAASGWITGHFVDTMIAMFGFGVLRVFSGGFHLKSLTACAIASAAIFTVIPFIEFSRTYAGLLTLITVILMALFSPSFRHHSMKTKRKRLNYKIISIILVLANGFLLSVPLVIAFLAQGLTLLYSREVITHEESNGG